MYQILWQIFGYYRCDTYSKFLAKSTPGSLILCFKNEAIERYDYQLLFNQIYLTKVIKKSLTMNYFYELTDFLRL